MTPALLLVSDQPDRFITLRRSTLAGRVVHLWLPDGVEAPEWAVAIRGDPASPATFSRVGSRDAIVVVDLADDKRAEEVTHAIRSGLPMAFVLLIDRERGRRHASDRAGVTWIDEGELLAGAIEAVLRRISSRKAVESLRASLDGASRCTFLVQDDPDPDAIASALALRTTLGLTASSAPIVSCGRVTRPENKRLLKELGIRVGHVKPSDIEDLAPLVLVDVQPPYFGDRLHDVAAVVDHHPPVGDYHARHRDVRTSYGASATMAAEYLLADGDAALTRPLATALLYGIITDTKSLSRSASDEDLAMFAFLFPRADHATLGRIQHPSYAPVALRRFGEALESATAHGGLAYLHLGKLPPEQEHIVAQLAEFCLGIAGAEVAAVSGVFGGKLVMSTRALSPDARLGERLRAHFGPYGSAGGHPVMAKAVLRLEAWRKDHPHDTDRALERSIRRALRAALNSPVARPAPRLRPRTRRSS